MTQSAQTTEVVFSADDMPKIAALGERLREIGEVTEDEATAADNIKRLWIQEQACRKAEEALEDAKAAVKEAKKALDQEFDTLRRMIAAYADPEQLS